MVSDTAKRLDDQIDRILAHLRDAQRSVVSMHLIGDECRQMTDEIVRDMREVRLESQRQLQCMRGMAAGAIVVAIVVWAVVLWAHWA